MMCCVQAVPVKSVRHDVLNAGSSSEECLLDMMCCMRALVVKSVRHVLYAGSSGEECQT